MRREFTGQAGSVPLILLLFVKQYQMVHVELVARSGQARAPAAGRNRAWLSEMSDDDPGRQVPYAHSL